MEELEIVKKLEEIAKPVIESEGLILYDTEYKREKSGWIVRFYIFRKEGYISIDDCVKISKRLNVLLDVEDLIAHPYNLEVSSPGLDRFLRKIEHFKLAIGEIVKLKLKEAYGGKKVFTGKILGVHNNEVIIEEDGDRYNLDFDNISNAKIQIDYFKGVKK